MNIPVEVVEVLKMFAALIAGLVVTEGIKALAGKKKIDGMQTLQDVLQGSQARIVAGLTMLVFYAFMQGIAYIPPDIQPYVINALMGVGSVLGGFGAYRLTHQ